MSYEEHKRLSSEIRARVALLAVSDSRTPETDESSRIMRNILGSKGHLITEQLLVKNDEEAISKTIEDLIHRQDIDAIITIGGTGLSKRDITTEVVSKFIEKRIEGFGELFRFLSYNQIGSGTIMSRALAGIVNRKIIMSIPGSPKGAELAAKELIAPELPHMIFEATK